MRSSGHALAVAVLGVLCACGGGGGGGGGSSIAGTWQFVSGPAFSGSEFDEEVFEGDPKFLVLDSDGHATLVMQEPTSLALFCSHGIYTTTSGSLLLQLNERFALPSFVFVREQPNAATLLLTDAGGSVSTFVRNSSLPPAFECQSLNVRATHAGLAEVPDFFTGLAWDGATLWFTSESSGIVPVDPVTGALGPPIPFLGFDQFQLVHAAQAGDLWLHCGCGHNEQAQRKTMAGVVVDEVHTDTDLGEEMVIFAIAYDETNALLWLQGTSFSLRSGRIMKVVSDVEPDVLVQTYDFDTRLRGLTWDGTALWGVTLAQTVVRIDPATLEVVATYESPNPRVEWAGIASAPASAGGGNSLYLIGEDQVASEGVLIEVQP